MINIDYITRALGENQKRFRAIDGELFAKIDSVRVVGQGGHGLVVNFCAGESVVSSARFTMGLRDDDELSVNIEAGAFIPVRITAG